MSVGLVGVGGRKGVEGLGQREGKTRAMERKAVVLL